MLARMENSDSGTGGTPRRKTLSERVKELFGLAGDVEEPEDGISGLFEGPSDDSGSGERGSHDPSGEAGDIVDPGNTGFAGGVVELGSDAFAGDTGDIGSTGDDDSGVLGLIARFFENLPTD